MKTILVPCMDFQTLLPLIDTPSLYGREGECSTL